MSEKKVLQVRVKPSTIDLLKKIAEKENRTIGSTIDILIEEAAIKAKLKKL